MIKQIAMVATLGLILTVGASTTIYPQYAYGNHNHQSISDSSVNGAHAASQIQGRGNGNGVNAGQTPPGLTAACAHPIVASHNPNC